MILFLTGVPGSGKTYFAVNYLYDTFINKKSKHFGENKRFVTNINGFNYDIFNGVGKPLDYDDLFGKLVFLFCMKEQGCNDNELVEKLKEYELDTTLFIIDECHSFFAKDDEILVWWLSYHRHFYHNILLVTQNLALVHRKYCSFSEFFYCAQASSLRIFSFIFRYKIYTDPRLFKKTEVKGFTLWFNKDVYALYHSGANQQSRRVVLYYFAIALVLGFITFFIFVSIPKIWSPPPSETDIPKPAQNQLQKIDVPVSLPSKNVYFMICRFDDCFIDGYRFSYSQIKLDFRKNIIFTKRRENYDEHFIVIDDNKKYLLGIK